MDSTLQPFGLITSTSKQQKRHIRDIISSNIQISFSRSVAYRKMFPDRTHRRYSELSNKHAANLIIFEIFSHLHALLEPTRLFIFEENSHLHDY